jgi:adenosylmethionine-8-amino-7-oxononanoate aminotransferase
MKITKYGGFPYHLWNPYTPMGKFIAFLGMGTTLLTRAEGRYVYNSQGKKFLDVNSGTWNFALGYEREEIIDAIYQQLHELPFAPLWGMSHPRAIELAARLVEITSGNFTHAILGSNGSEAVEAALKMARQFHRQSSNPVDHGRYKIISLRGSYHGLGYGAVSAAGKTEYEEKFGPLMPGFVQIGPPYCYRCPFQQSGYPACGLACAKALEETILSEGPESVAAFIFEPVMGEANVIVPPAEYYPRVGEICQRYGVLLIADEVTTGFGRAGKLFASQDWSIQPDILCLGKIISGGYLPLSATLASERVFDRFLGKDRQFLHGSTHSGHPVCAAAGLAAIDIILREKLPENSARVGAYMKAGLERLQSKYPFIGEVRGQGLMIGVELVKDRETKQPFTTDELFYVTYDLVERGLIVSLDTLRLFPPLNIDEPTADRVLKIIDQSLGSSRVEKYWRLGSDFVMAKLIPPKVKLGGNRKTKQEI